MTHVNLNTRAILLTAMLWAGNGVLMAKADPLTDPSVQVLPDPSPKESRDFPPALATSGTADPSHELTAVKTINLQGCTALNPCAAPPPSLGAGPAPARTASAANPG
jgi:hypothetical protein